MRFLFVMDPPGSMLPDKDTTFAFMRGALARGHECWCCLAHDVGYRDRRVEALAQRLIVSDSPPHVTLFEQRRLQALALDAVFVRKDPPFDDAYLHLTQILDLAAGHCFVFNAPRGLQLANEKLFALRFDSWLPRTLISSEPKELVEFLGAIGGHGVIKPLDGAGGFGVMLLSQEDKNKRAIVDLLTLEGRRSALLQEYLPEVRDGDKRVLMLDGKLLGAIRRVPQRDDIRANIHVGGTVEPTTLSEREAVLVAEVGPQLTELGLYFVGLDLIGERLIEVNVTSPTGIQQLSRHVGRPLEQDVIAWVERRVVELSSKAPR
jgi:glutathione synthase